MSDKIQLTQEELQVLKTITTRNEQLSSELSSIGLLKLQIKEREEQCGIFYKDTKTYEKELSSKLEQKYGNGSIDLQTGEFTPIN